MKNINNKEAHNKLEYIEWKTEGHNTDEITK